MPKTVVFLTIPGLRSRDLGSLPRLLELSRQGVAIPLGRSCPALACPVQASLTTGVGPEQHGIVADRRYVRDLGRVERWTEWNRPVETPQLWETLKQKDPSITSAVWFAQLSKGARADLVCSPIPIPNPDGSATPWCDSQPAELYGTLREAVGHFPFQEFRGPGASIRSTAWIVDSFVQTAYVFRPRFSFVSLPHLDQAARQFGPDSSQALTALGELDMAIGALVDGFAAAGIRDVTWLAASEYCITPVSTVASPNRVLREAGLLTPIVRDGREHLVPHETAAFAMVDEQVAHVYVREPANIARAAEALRGEPAVADVLIGDERSRVGLNHPNSGEIVLLARPDAWFADDWRPIDAMTVKGSHGLLETGTSNDSILVCSESASCLSGKDAGIRDVDIAAIVHALFGLS